MHCETKAEVFTDVLGGELGSNEERQKEKKKKTERQIDTLLIPEGNSLFSCLLIYATVHTQKCEGAMRNNKY